MNKDRRSISTWTRFWDYPSVFRGLPGGFTFGRPILQRTVYTFLVLAFVALILRLKFGIGPSDPFWALWWHLGVPGVAAYGAGKAQTNGKRLDRWVISHIRYRFGPQVSDRYRAVEPRPVLYKFKERGRS